LNIFLSGIIQGSLPGKDIHGQDYREAIKAILRSHVPDAEVLCPLDLHPNSPEYDMETSRATFLQMIHLAETADLVVAYVPEASMGTAVEMWKAHERGVPVISISALPNNWIVKLASRRVFPTIEAFEQFLANGGLRELGLQP